MTSLISILIPAQHCSDRQLQAELDECMFSPAGSMPGQATASVGSTHARRGKETKDS